MKTRTGLSHYPCDPEGEARSREACAAAGLPYCTLSCLDLGVQYYRPSITPKRPKPQRVSLEDLLLPAQAPRRRAPKSSLPRKRKGESHAATPSLARVLGSNPDVAVVTRVRGRVTIVLARGADPTSILSTLEHVKDPTTC